MDCDEVIKLIMKKVETYMNVASLLQNQNDEIKKLKSTSQISKLNNKSIIYEILDGNKIKVTPTNNVEMMDLANETLNIEKNKEDLIMAKGSVSLRKDGRYQGSFYFLKKRIFVYAESENKCWIKMRNKKKELEKSQNENEKSNSFNSLNRNMTLNHWFDYWVETFAKKTTKESTYIGYTIIYDRHVRNNFGKNKISFITTTMIQEHFNNIPSKSGKRYVAVIFNKLFKLLNDDGKIKHNPMSLVVIPKDTLNDKPKEIEGTIKILNYSDEVYILNNINNKSLVNAIIFCLYTGVRRGELLGLTWDDIDFEKNQIAINKQWTYTMKKITSPKSKAAYRYIPMLPNVKELLQNMYVYNSDHTSRIFSDVDRFTHLIVYISNRLNIDVNPHMFRHTFASRLYAAGVDPLIMKKMLGHESIDTSLNVYSHIIDNSNLDVVKAIREHFIKIGIITERL